MVGPLRSRRRPHSPEIDWIELIAAADGVSLNFLVARLPAPVEEDLSKGILGTIDRDSCRVEKQGRTDQLTETITLPAFAVAAERR
jgi:hypothetical protein